MAIAPLQETGSRFMADGMSALAYSVGSKAASSRCITIAEISLFFTCSSKAAMSEKPTVPSSWAAAKVGWEARAMRSHYEQQAQIAREQGLQVRARMEARSRGSAPPPKHRDSSE